MPMFPCEVPRHLPSARLPWSRPDDSPGFLLKRYFLSKSTCDMSSLQSSSRRLVQRLLGTFTWPGQQNARIALSHLPWLGRNSIHSLCGVSLFNTVGRSDSATSEHGVVCVKSGGSDCECRLRSMYLEVMSLAPRYCIFRFTRALQWICTAINSYSHSSMVHIYQVTTYLLLM